MHFKCFSLLVDPTKLSTHKLLNAFAGFCVFFNRTLRPMRLSASINQIFPSGGSCFQKVAHAYEPFELIACFQTAQRQKYCANNTSCCRCYEYYICKQNISKNAQTICLLARKFLLTALLILARHAKVCRKLHWVLASVSNYRSYALHYSLHYTYMSIVQFSSLTCK